MRLRAGQSVPAGEVSVSVEDLSVSEGKEDLIPAGSSLTLSAVVENPGTDENLPEEEEQDSASSDNGVEHQTRQKAVGLRRKNLL